MEFVIGGHYLAYCRNEVDNNWYEFDDTIVTRLEVADVMGKEAYVLFYQRRGDDDMERTLICPDGQAEVLQALDARVKSASRYYPAITYAHYLPPNAISKCWISKWGAFVDGDELGLSQVFCMSGIHPTEEEVAEMVAKVEPSIVEALQAMRNSQETNVPSALLSATLPQEYAT
uniref:USP domain-containing protein n=1 Tax=Parascaris equorum TaxID=6256 RepID=A0A914RH09_PAREQ